MRPVISASLLSSVQRLVQVGFAEATMSAGGGEIRQSPMAEFQADVAHLKQQLQVFADNGILPRVAKFRDETAREMEIEIPIRVDNLDDVGRASSATYAKLRKGGLTLRSVSPENFEELFVTSLAEFIAAGTSSAVGSLTTVQSNRSGDTVLVAKGYFLSTSEGFGVSTPATAYLTPGRYSFGILKPDGSSEFQPIVWTCPCVVRLNLP